MMKVIEKIKAFFEQKGEQWYIICAFVVVFEVINTSLVSLFAPTGVYVAVRIALILAVTFYVGVMYKYFKTKYKNFVRDEKEKVLNRIDKFEHKMNELLEQQVELLKESTKNINDNMNEKTLYIVEKVNSCVQNVGNEMINNLCITKDVICVEVESETEKIMECTKQQYNESANMNKVQFSKVEKQLYEQKESIEQSVKKQEERTKLSVDCICDKMQETETLLKNASDDIMKNLIKIIEEAAVNNAKTDMVICTNKDEIIKALEKKSFRDEEIRVETMEKIETTDKSLKEIVSFSQNLLLADLKNMLEITDQNHLMQYSLLEKVESEVIRGSREMQMAISDAVKEEKELCEDFANKTIVLGERLETKIEEFNIKNRDAFENIAVCVTDVKESLLLELVENQKQNIENNHTIEVELKQIVDLLNSNAEILSDENKNHTDYIVNEIRTNSQQNLETCQGVKSKVDELQENINSGQETMKNHLTKSMYEIEGFVKDARMNIEKQTEQLHEVLENNLSEKIDKIILIEQEITDSIVEEKEAVKQIDSSVAETKEIVKEENLKLRDILELNVKRISTQIEQNIEKTENICLKTIELQNFVTNLINQVLDNIENTDERMEASYNRVYEQVSGFSKSVKESLNKIIIHLDEQKLLLDKEMDLYTLSANTQFEQSNEIKKEIIENSRLYQSYQLELKARVENLQNQILAMNSLAEVLRNISSVSADKTNPDRVEKIVDKENGVVVQNHFRKNKLVMSEMLTNGKKSYDTEYGDSGQIVKTRNYGSDGTVVTELHFYSNGQVKTRIENIKVNGMIKKVITEFDERGNKK